jgi:hypothetical protein
MTKNDSYDQISPCDETDSFSEVARKLGRGFAARSRDHDETGNFVAENFGELKAQRFMNPATGRWLFIMPQDSAGCGAGLCSIEAQVEPGTGQNFITESPYVHI